jgi:sulfur carrier protein
VRARVNGEEIELDVTSIAALVEQVTGTPERRGIAVARNGEIVRRDDWAQGVEDGDEFEIVRAVQGG